MRLDRIELRGREVERQRQQQPLRGRAIARELTHDVFIQDPLVSGVLVHNRDTMVGLEEDVGIENLKKRRHRLSAVSRRLSIREELQRQA